MGKPSSATSQTMLQIREWIDFALDRNDVGYLSNMIRVRWNKRFIRKFADAGYGKSPPRGIIRLSPRIWERASEMERRKTIIHEACHIVAFHLHGTEIKPHGIEWRQAMENCSVEPVRCHNIPLVGIALFPVLGCPKPKTDRCIVSRRDFGLMKQSDYTLHCTLCGLAINAERVEC